MLLLELAALLRLHHGGGGRRRSPRPGPGARRLVVDPPGVAIPLLTGRAAAVTVTGAAHSHLASD